MIKASCIVVSLAVSLCAHALKMTAETDSRETLNPSSTISAMTASDFESDFSDFIATPSAENLANDMISYFYRTIYKTVAG